MAPLPFLTRLWFAWVCFFRVLFDGAFAARVFGLGSVPPELEARDARETPKLEDKKSKRPGDVAADKASSSDAALSLLALLQREGRLVDFLEEDVASFTDADIGAAARVVHTGCRKALREHVTLEPVRKEEEGAKVTLNGASHEVREVKLTGNVQGKGPHTGTLRHRGWRAVDVKLPTSIEGHDARIVAQAEVEL